MDLAHEPHPFLTFILMTPILFAAILASAVIAARLLSGAIVRKRSEDLVDASVESALAVPLPEGNGSWLSRWLSRAGYRSPSASLLFWGATAACAAVGLALVLALNKIQYFATVIDNVSAIPGGVGDLLAAVAKAGPYLILAILISIPALVVRAARRARVEAVEQDLAPCLELLATLAEAGLGFDAALARIQESESSRRPLYQEFRIYQLDTLGGIPRADGLRNVARRTHLPSVSIFISALIQAEQVGASLAETLRTQADDLRDRRKLRALVLAQALPVKLVFPLIFCFLPGIFFSTLGPVISQFVEMMDSLMRGR